MDSFELFPAVLPERYESAWYLGADVLLHVQGNAWLTARARTNEALDVVRAQVPGYWVDC